MDFGAAVVLSVGFLAILAGLQGLYWLYQGLARWLTHHWPWRR